MSNKTEKQMRWAVERWEEGGGGVAYNNLLLIVCCCSTLCLPISLSGSHSTHTYVCVRACVSACLCSCTITFSLFKLCFDPRIWVNHLKSIARIPNINIIIDLFHIYRWRCEYVGCFVLLLFGYSVDKLMINCDEIPKCTDRFAVFIVKTPYPRFRWVDMTWLDLTWLPTNRFIKSLWQR